MKDDSIGAFVREGVRSSRSLGITGTPTFLVGLMQADGRVAVKRALSGTQSNRVLGDVVDELLHDAAK